ncbi:sensor histidine kinase [Massilia arenosa]|uniref:Sensor histidine kinase n=1 Tax=Zemynaea arenosa TaxID=2561931 RepID=A0A4Y9SGD6_9BURK|nr:histidine kinase [Massilia arenosa]TFW20396.1 sensor histidine kinase [Massilia arenosa]
MAEQPPATAATLTPRTLALAISGFWCAFLALYTVRTALLGYEHQVFWLFRRLAAALIGGLLSLLLAVVIRKLQGRPARTRIATALALCLPCGALFATAGWVLFDNIAPLPGEDCNNGLACTPFAVLEYISELTISWTFVFAAWTLLLFALDSAARVRAAERAAADAREAARLAELRALRYQVNPHFLFNVLNSLLGLVSAQRLAEAEQLIGELGRYLRHNLTMDATQRITLADEVERQLGYLRIEAHRFPDRMSVQVDIAPDAARVPVPALLLQPLVENAIKHGLARSTGLVEIRLRAFVRGGELALVVEDNARPEQQAGSEGFGIGLANVAQRLNAEFGSAGRLQAGVCTDGGFRVELSLPVVA